MNDKALIIRKEILDKSTTLTYGRDVSSVLSHVMESEPLAGAVHIMSEETMTGGEILDIYRKAIQDELDKDIQIMCSSDMGEIEELFEGGYNTKYDRLYNRAFDNSLAEKLYGHIDYMEMRKGLDKCLRAFITDWKVYGNSIFAPVMPEFEELMDQMIAGREINA